MNKKFSTFLAGLALTGAMFSANAQSEWREFQPLRDVTTTLPQKVASYEENTDYLYVLSVANGTTPSSTPTSRVLALDANGNFVIRDIASSANRIDATNLWCVDVTAESAENRTYTYSFLNKGKSEYLGVDVTSELKGLAQDGTTTTVASAGIELTGWSLSNNLSNMEAGAIYSTLTYDRDSVVGLVVTGSNVYLKKASLSAAMRGTAGFTNFVMSTLNDIRLDKTDLNTLLATKTTADGFTLAFYPDTEGVANPFTGKVLVADDPFQQSSTPNVTTFGEYVTIRDKDGNYLVVDTSYYNTSGDRYLEFAWYGDSIVGSPVLEPRANFAVTYNPSTDQVYIQVQEVSFINKVNDVDVKPNWESALVGTTDTTIYSNSYVSRQNLLTSTTVLTVNATQNTEIKLGIGGCTPTTNRISLDDDLYLIRSGNRYLAVPIYGDSVPQWVTLPVNVEPWQMPAFQWVVEKTQRTNDAVRNASPVRITNREFPNVKYTTDLQFYEGNNYVNGTVINTDKDVRVSANVRASFFVKDPANYKADQYLGYRKFDSDSIRVTSYQLRYLHGLSVDTYVGGDSILSVGNNKGIYQLDTVRNANANTTTVLNYGYTTSNVRGLAQLKRQAYTVKVKNTNKYIGHDSEDFYTVSAYNDTTSTLSNPNANRDRVAARFFFKANNYKDGSIYYAMVDTFGYYGLAPDSLRKVVVDDNAVTLNADVMYSDRTSAFAIEVDDTPIYRRFGTDPAEGVEANNDESVAMRFIEAYRGEVLQIEANRNFNPHPGALDFLGIDRADKAPSGLAFNVDTAWVNRGLGYIKPQYLISIDRRDYGGRAIQLCQDDFHGYAADGTPLTAEQCPHTIAGAPAFERGKYLVNLPETYAGYTSETLIWRGKYDRAGFVHGIRVQDTLYILNNNVYDFYEFDNSTINLDVIVAEANKNNGNVRRHVLTGDAHKYVTWSMRYRDIENIDTDNSFLIESMSETGNDWIQPNKAQWLKMNNGCLVLSDATESYFNEMTGISTQDDVLVFNVEYVEGDQVATDNDKVATTEVKVIASEGKVTVLNAAGKKVVVSNILGQTVANTVLSSDNASIAAPKGIVVVAVEGEEPVKAIVK